MELVPFSKAWLDQYYDMMQSMDDHDLRLIGSNRMSKDEIQGSFHGPHRWDRLMVEDGRVIGDVNLFFSDSSAEVNIFLVPESRGKGFASAALDSAIKQAHGMHLTKIVAKVDDGNTLAKVFFEKHGFLLDKKICAFNQSEYVLPLLV